MAISRREHFGVPLRFSNDPNTTSKPNLNATLKPQNHNRQSILKMIHENNNRYSGLMQENQNIKAFNNTNNLIPTQNLQKIFTNEQNTDQGKQ